MKIKLQVQAKLSAAPDVLPFRERYREERNCQIVHDSIHRRAGWTLTYLLESAGVAVGFGSVALGGAWKGKPTLRRRSLRPLQSNQHRLAPHTPKGWFHSLRAHAHGSPYELPIKIPARKTSAPPSPTCNRADTSGVSMNLCRTHEMAPSSASTTHTATLVAVFTFGIK